MTDWTADLLERLADQEDPGKVADIEALHGRLVARGGIST